jgi:hypothetical protein
LREPQPPSHVVCDQVPVSLGRQVLEQAGQAAGLAAWVAEQRDDERPAGHAVPRYVRGFVNANKVASMNLVNA